MTNASARPGAPGPSQPSNRPSRRSPEVLGLTWATPCFAFACVVLVLWTFGPTTDNGFTNLDDDQVIVNNPHYRGLSADRLQWMFTTRWMGQYQPVTWISYATDLLIGGHSARTYHAANVLWHSAPTIALFLLIRTLLLLAMGSQQGASTPRSRAVNWASFLGAAAWALNPLRVEPVAWVTGRNDLLSGCFGILGVLTWLRYASGNDRSAPQVPGWWRPVILAASGLALFAGSITAKGDDLQLGRLGWFGLIGAAVLLTISIAEIAVAIGRSRSRTDVMWYGIAWFLCTLSLLAKPWLLTLPVLLLVLDGWPLRRFRIDVPGQNRASAEVRLSRARDLALEKLPFVITCFVTGILGMWAKRGGATLLADENLPSWSERLAQSCQAIVFHLYKTVAPTGLKPIVDRPAHMSLTEAPFLGAALAVTALLVILFFVRRRSPATTIAFICYVLLLAPSLGLVAYGFQLVADRYSYLSTIPVFILLSGSVLTVWTMSPNSGRFVLGAAACSLLLASSAVSRKQVGVWQDSERLWTHTLSLGETPRALANLALVRDGQAHAIVPPASHSLPGSAVRLSNRAVELAREQGTFVPEYLLVQGTVQLNAGQTERAAALLREFTDARPENVQGLINLGLALNQLGRFQEASQFLQRAVRRRPDDARAWRFLGHALDGAGLTDQALEAYERSARNGVIDDRTMARIEMLRSTRVRR